MTDNELKEIREKISCHQFGDNHYGERGCMTPYQRRTIKRMIDYIKGQKAEIERLNYENLQMIASIKNLKAEAIKEYVDRLTAELIAGGIYPAFVKGKIEKVKKEMVGDV